MDIQETKKQVNKLFRTLRKHGVFAKQNYCDCQSCGWARAEQESQQGQPIAFYHNQDNEVWTDEKQKNLYIAFSDLKTANLIVNTAAQLGLVTDWDKTENTRVKILVRGQ